MKRLMTRTLALGIMLAMIFSALVPGQAAAATLARPTIHVADSDADGNPQITIDKVKGATGYRIYRKTPTDKKWVKVATTRKRAYVDKKWTADEAATIYYTVKAYTKNADGTVTWSKTAEKQSWTVPEHKDGDVIGKDKKLPKLENTDADFYPGSVLTFYTEDGSFQLWQGPDGTGGRKPEPSENISYDRETNTLYLEGFAARQMEIKWMGKNITIHLSGDNKLSSLTVYGSSVTFAGNGSLTLNEGDYWDRGVDGRGEQGLLLMGEDAGECIMIESGVTLDIYGRQSAIHISKGNRTKGIYYQSEETVPGIMQYKHGLDSDGKVTWWVCRDNSLRCLHFHVGPEK